MELFGRHIVLDSVVLHGSIRQGEHSRRLQLGLLHALPVVLFVLCTSCGYHLTECYDCIYAVCDPLFVCHCVLWCCTATASAALLLAQMDVPPQSVHVDY